MLKEYVQVKNVSGEPRRIFDRQLANGSLSLGPGEEYGLPVAVYMRVRRLCQTWLANTEVVPVEEPAEAEAAVPEPAEPETVEAEPEPEAEAEVEEPKPKARKRKKGHER